MEDLHSVWGHRWVTPKARSFKSGMHGLGIVAKERISKGETVGVLGGLIIPVAEIDKYREKMGHVGIQIDDDFFICPSDRKELEETGIFNHSCDPNCGYDSVIKFVAIRDILPGEELTFDYACGEPYFPPFECKCGSPKCRKVIKADDWKNKEIQKRLGKFFAPWLKKKL